MTDKEQLIRDIISDDDKIVMIISSAPQTYNSILQHMKDDGTMQQILRRRVSRLLKENKIWKMRVPGTRFGLCIFCTPDREYKILISQCLTSVKIYYMLDFNEDENNVILENYWELMGPNWSRWVYNDTPINIPKYRLREGGFRLWE
jgi:hypothetical protein